MEYVFSGLAYTRATTTRWDKGDKDKLQAVVNGAFNSINKETDYLVGGLFNAYTEKAVTDVLPRFPFDEIHADSGGLQMALFGKQVTEEIKREIYVTQGTHATIAMCFDDIPLYTAAVSKGESSSLRTRIDNKTFLTPQLEERARNTGRNVNEQLKTFKEIGSKTKVMLIAQGNQPQDFADFIRYQYDEIDPELRDGIKGIALADTCIGNDVMESIDMMYGFKLIDIPEQYKQHIHLLGVGSISRLMPTIELMRSGFLAPDLHVSFDSTTHTSAYVMGKLIDEAGTRLQLGTSPNNVNIAFMGNLYDTYLAPIYGASYKDEYIKWKTQNLRGSKHIHEEGVVGDLGFITYFLAPFHQAKIFMQCVNNCRNDFNAYEKYIGNKRLILAMNQLSKVQTIGDIEAYRKKFAPYIGSKRIARGQSIDDIKVNTLDGLFED